MIFESFSAQESFDFAAEMAKKAKVGDIFCLQGEVAAGKTVFAKGFAAGLSIFDEVTSPTFNILKVYEGENAKLFHFDVYRIKNNEEMQAIDYEDYFFGDGICVIEWAEQIQALIPDEAVWIKFSGGFENENYRRIEIC